MGGLQTSRGRQHVNLPDFLKNCMKLRKFWSVGGGAPLDPSLVPIFVSISYSSNFLYPSSIIVSIRSLQCGMCLDTSFLIRSVECKELFTLYDCDCDFISQRMDCIGFNNMFTWFDCDNDTKGRFTPNDSVTVTVTFTGGAFDLWRALWWAKWVAYWFFPSMWCLLQWRCHSV